MDDKTQVLHTRSLTAWIAPIVLVAALAVLVLMLSMRLDREILTNRTAPAPPTATAPMIQAHPIPTPGPAIPPPSAAAQPSPPPARPLSPDVRFLAELRSQGIYVMPGTERAFATVARDVCTAPDLQAWAESEEVDLTNHALADWQVTYMITAARNAYC